MHCQCHDIVDILANKLYYESMTCVNLFRLCGKNGKSTQRPDFQAVFTK